MGISDTLVELIKLFLKNRFQRVVLDGRTSEWLLVKAGVPQGYVLADLFILIYINDLSNDMIFTVKLFADDSSLFSIAHDAKTYKLNKDLQKNFWMGISLERVI